MKATVLIHVYINEPKEIMTTVIAGKVPCVFQMTGGFGSSLNFSLTTVEKKTVPKDMISVGWLPDQRYCNLDSF